MASGSCEDANKMGRSTDIRTKPTEESPSGANTREDAIRWAHSLVSGGEFVVLDSETTGLGAPVDFVEVGIVCSTGKPLFDSLIRPSCFMEPGASRVHGHTAESLEGERSFLEVYPDLLDTLWEKRVVVYSASYDRRVWDAAVGRLGARKLLAGELPRPGSARCEHSRPTWASGQRGVATSTRSCRAATTRL